MYAGYEASGSPSCTKCHSEFIAAQMSLTAYEALMERMPRQRWARYRRDGTSTSRKYRYTPNNPFVDWRGAFDESVYIDFFGFTEDGPFW